jgi:hypothetical protein
MEHSANCSNQRPPPTPHRVEPDFRCLGRHYSLQVAHQPDQLVVGRSVRSGIAGWNSPRYARRPCRWWTRLSGDLNSYETNMSPVRAADLPVAKHLPLPPVSCASTPPQLVRVWVTVVNEAARSRMVFRAVEVNQALRWRCAVAGENQGCHFAVPSAVSSGSDAYSSGALGCAVIGAVRHVRHVPHAPLPSPSSASLCGGVDRLPFARSIQNALAWSAVLGQSSSINQFRATIGRSLAPNHLVGSVFDPSRPTEESFDLSERWVALNAFGRSAVRIYWVEVCDGVE